jgi:hypothetical protein
MIWVFMAFKGWVVKDRGEAMLRAGTGKLTVSKRLRCGPAALLNAMGQKKPGVCRAVLVAA